MSKHSFNDEAWEKLFVKYSILDRIGKEGLFNISAKQIKEFREPRLMTKFDHSINLPKLFADNKLTILPITRGDYVISHFDAYHEFEIDNSDSPVVKGLLPNHIQSLDSSSIASEAIAINYAVASGIIYDFIEDDSVFATVSGRMGSGAFSFGIGDTVTRGVHHITVKNAQIEIDAAYEGIASLAIIEAKRSLSNDFLIRQLYYPFCVWRKKVTKPIKTIFLIYSNGIYKMYEYMFCNPNNYSSIKLVKQKNYSVEDTTISSSDIQSVLDSVTTADEPRIPFPQADSFERVINLCELIGTQELTRADITEQYAFDVRQTNYYTDAARYLGLIEKTDDDGQPVYSITNKGRSILKLGYKERQLEYCKLILSHEAFNETLKMYFREGVMPSKQEIVGIMRQSNLYNIFSESTFERRSSSIKSWVNWIVSLINDY